MKSESMIFFSIGNTKAFEGINFWESLSQMPSLTLTFHAFSALTVSHGVSHHIGCKNHE